jgi:hypothetical protein
MSTADTSTLVVDLALNGHLYEGMGVHMWAADLDGTAPETSPVYTQALAPLGMKRVRIDFNAPWGYVDRPGLIYPDKDASPQAFDAFASAELNSATVWPFFDLAHIQKLFTFLRSRQIGVVQTFFWAPQKYRLDGPFDEGGNTAIRHLIRDEYVRSAAQLMAAQLKWQFEHGVLPEYLEPFNEPDGDWNQYFTPAQYARFILELDKALRERGLSGKVKVVGPGVAFSAAQPAFIDALLVHDAAFGKRALDGLWGLSVHLYDDRLEPPLRPDPDNGMNFMALKGLGKPIIITEMSALERERGWQDGLPVNASAEELYTWGLRLAGNMTNVVSNGASTGLLWVAKEQSWESRDASNPRGMWLLDRDNTPREPTLRVLRELFSRLPTTSDVLSLTPANNTSLQLNFLAVRTQDKVFFLVVNASDAVRSVSFRFPGNYRALPLFKTSVFFDGSEVQAVTRAIANTDRDAFAMSIPARSAQVVEADLAHSPDLFLWEGQPYLCGASHYKESAPWYEFNSQLCAVTSMSQYVSNVEPTFQLTKFSWQGGVYEAICDATPVQSGYYVNGDHRSQTGKPCSHRYLGLDVTHTCTVSKFSWENQFHEARCDCGVPTGNGFYPNTNHISPLGNVCYHRMLDE